MGGHSFDISPTRGAARRNRRELAVKRLVQWRYSYQLVEHGLKSRAGSS
jgi:hypothetical protein